MTPKRLALIIVPVVVIAATLLTLRLTTRSMVMSKVLRTPQIKQRVAMIPVKRTLGLPPVVQPIDLGYATFDTGSQEPVSLATETDGITANLHNVDASIKFFAPHGLLPVVTPSIFSSSLDSPLHPLRNAYLRLQETDPVAAHTQMEKTQPLPFWQIGTMRSDAFLLYTHLLISKGSVGVGLNEVQVFENSSVKGLVRIGMTPSDRQSAHVMFSSPSGAMRVECYLKLALTTPKKLADVLDPIIGSFRFTTDRVDDRKRIEVLVRAAVVSQKARNP